MDFSNQNLKQAYQNKQIKIYDYDEVKKDFIFIDDNQPVYQRASLDKPSLHYANTDWHNCIITYFVAPLYPKIYLEAYEAKSFVLNFLVSGSVSLLNNSEVVLRFFLSSTRSLKDKIAQNNIMQADLKKIILSSMMPKFVWVAEISTKDLIKQKLANGIIILDATEANTLWYKPLLFAAYQDKYIYFDTNIGQLVNNSFTLHNFCIFENNLK